jgi:hypothetical protein
VRRGSGKGGDESSTYVALRRILLFLERSLSRGLQSIGFEPSRGRWRRKR